VITAPNTDLNVIDGQTDGHCTASPRGKKGRQIITDIIGITDILSQ